MRRLRRLFARAEPDQNEINILRGILVALDPAAAKVPAKYSGEMGKGGLQEQ
jgi:tRNA C32,U32 (ribose-2'-O)-methylase TrmJ